MFGGEKLLPNLKGGLGVCKKKKRIRGNDNTTLGSGMRTQPVKESEFKKM